jgi:hypothetical protein
LVSTGIRRNLALPVLEFLANIGAYVGVSLLRPPDGCRGDAGDGIRRRAEGKRSGRAQCCGAGRAKVSDLQELVGRFLGPTERAQTLVLLPMRRRHGVGRAA